MKVISTSLFLILSFALQGQGLDDSNPKESENKEIQLFNGRNLNGWYTFLENRGKNTDPKKVFTVDNGLIRISGEEWGCITTKKEYANYKLTVEFKWGEKAFAPRIENARDSGILLHSVGEDGGSQGIWMYSIECQVIEGGTGDFIVVGDGSDNFSISAEVAPEKQGLSSVFQPGGQAKTFNRGRINWFDRSPNWKDEFGFRGENDLEKPVGEWNTIICIAKGDEISNYLNGVLVNRAFNVRPNKGRIQIQSEAAELFIRRIDLQAF